MSNEVKQMSLRPSGLLCDPCFYGECHERRSAVVIFENETTKKLLCGNHAEVLASEPLENIAPIGRKKARMQ